MSEDPWDDWETAADAGLIDCKELKKVTPVAKSNQDIWEKANAYSIPTIIHTNNDAGRSEYKPEVKILKRPDGPRNARVGATVAPKSTKNLADREKEYEEAKRKIDEKFNKIKK